MTLVLQDLVTRQAELSPEAMALVFGEERLCYQELEELSNRLARLLRACKADDRVCLLLPKSLAAIVSILGVLKAGCIYVPVDIRSPAARLVKILESCECRCVLAVGAAGKVLGELDSAGILGSKARIGWLEPRSTARGFAMDFCWKNLASVPAGPLDRRNTSASIAHILFTSGSTGVPKGVQIKHSNVIDFVRWANRYFGTSSSDGTGGFEGVAICCAYVPAGGSVVGSQSLRKCLTEVLPRYMLPSRWMCLNSLPRNGSGKTDRQRLREQFEAVPREAVSV